MAGSAHGWSDERVEQALGTLLRTGVGIAGAVVLVGGIIYLLRHGAEQPVYHVFRGEPADLKNVRGILASVFQGRGRGFIQLGLVLLIMTPLARVVFSVISFAMQRDWTYVVITLIVLATLLYSLAGGSL